MAASAGAWYRVGKVNVTNNNQSVVGVDTNWQSDVIAIAIGDIFTLDAKTWYEVVAVNSDTSITLDRGFEGSTGTNKTYAIVRNTSGTILTRIAGQVSVQFNQKQLFLDELRTWLNSDNASEELTDSHGLKQSLKTPTQMVRDHDEKLAELDAIHPFPYAMRKVEFELNRKNTKRLYDASGFISFGSSNENTSPVIKDVGNGLFTREFNNSLRTLILGANRSISNVDGFSKHDFPKLVVNGVTHTLASGSELSAEYGIEIYFPDAEDGTRTVNKTTGQVTQHSTAKIAFSFEDDDNEVIYKRVDLWGIETFLRAVSESDPFVYRYGYIQSAAADINGVETTQDNVRPDTYFQQFEGDTRLRRQGVNWFLATESQKIKIASDPGNNIYYDDSTGLFHQFCFRVRTFAGRGNAEWSNIDSSDMSTYLNYKASSPAIRVTPQGIRSVQSPLGSVYPLFSARDTTNVHEKLYENYGAYGAISESNQVDLSSAVDGECYFYVGGTVNRLNKGAYHPTFNHLGTAYSGIADDLSNRVFWDHASALLVDTKSCFIDVSIAANANGSFTTMSTVNGRLPRPDDRYHDIIYPGGFGGVSRDMRLSAKAFNPNDFNSVFLDLFSGKSRGTEVIPFTYVTASSFEGSATNTSYHPVGVAGVDDIILGRKVQVLWIINGLEVTKVENFVSSTVYDSNGVYYVRTGSNVSRQETTHYVMQLGGEYYISDTFQNMDVVGSPASILATPILSKGWHGQWIPNNQDITTFKYSRRPTSHLIVQKTYDFGSTWSVDAWSGFDSASNTRTAGLSEAWVSINSYLAKASLTEYSEFGFSDVSLKEIDVVHVSSDGYHPTGRGALLKQSLTKETSGTSSYSNGAIQSLVLRQLPSVDTDGRIVSTVRSGYIAKHDSLVIDGLNGVKTLPVLAGVDRKQYMYFSFAELNNNGTSWGDDGRIKFTGGLSFFVDDNGKTMKYGTARFIQPLGWVRNEK